MNSALLRLNHIFREVLDDDRLRLETASEELIEGWDSLAHVELMLAVESVFDVTLTNEEIAGMTSSLAIVQVLQKHGVGIS